MPKSQICVIVPGAQVTKLDKLAKRDGRSRSSYAARVLEKHLAEVAQPERKAA